MTYHIYTQILHSISFLLLVMLMGDIMALPWEIYSVFVIEQRHGFNKQVGVCRTIAYCTYDSNGR